MERASPHPPPPVPLPPKPATKRWTWLLQTTIAVAVIVAGFFAWQYFKPKGLPDGFASGNGRIEATEIDVAAKIPGRIREILVNEGDFVAAGQIVVRMDTAVLEAQRREAEAQLRMAIIAINVARSQVTQREAEKAAAEAVVAQREADLDGARRRFARSEELAPRSAVPYSRLDDDRAAFLAARAAIGTARAQVAAADAALNAAQAMVIGAEAAVDSTRATIERIQADIDDSQLRSPRDGRVQYRVAEPGEVLPAGGRVLNLVDLADVYMTFFLPTAAAGHVAMGAEARLVLDAAAQYVIPGQVSFVADVAQFTPRTVETEEERLRLMFRIKVRISPDLLRDYVRDVKAGLPGMAYVRLDPRAEWPAALQVRLPPPAGRAP
ncbi:HlyD family efflux transporter periplasmic adaptor subunit [Roseomonas eburnea]|uniref:HlyD family efflux transporter periplasmic adaptor subunit n=1 Tax=Neoroseomonas eburnea TaxID=1346889 RepID=A0A9X9XJG7_9PROT|nr:HlyD family efflux transporter periplasmic adaptor subunit [Neoroseomonas eburnea]